MPKKKATAKKIDKRKPKVDRKKAKPSKIKRAKAVVVKEGDAVGFPQDIKDIVLGQTPKVAKKDMDLSAIFPKEMASRIRELFKPSGVEGFQHTFSRLAISNTTGQFALPSHGDVSFVAPDAVNAGASMGIKASLNDDKGSKIEGSLSIEAAAGNVSTLQPFFHSPGNAQDAYNLPKSYVEQIRWSRIMYNLNPYINSITNLKAYYPLSKFKLTTPEAWITQFYENCAFNKDFNLYRFILRANLVLKKFGELIVWGTRKQDGVWPQTGQPKYVWANLIILEPELVEIKKHMMGDGHPSFFLRPNRDMEELVRKLRNNDPSVASEQGKIAEPIMKKIERRELVPMDATTISAIQNLTDGGGERGTPPYQCLYTNYIFEDFVRIALMAQANRYHFPIEMWTLGNLEKGIMPSVADLLNLKELVTQAIQNPPFTIFYPPLLDYKAEGVSGSLMNIKDDMEFAHRQYLIGMGVNENMILGDSGIFSSNETAGNQSFIRMMQKDRDEIEEWMRWHFFEPLAQWNNLKQNKNGTVVPIIPDIEWNKTLDFKAEDDMAEKTKYGFENGLIDPDTFIRTYLKRDPQEMAIKIQKAIGGPFDNGERFGSAAMRESAGKAPEAAGGEGGVGEGGAEAAKPGGGGEGPELSPKAETAAPANEAPAEAGAEAKPTEGA